MVKLINAFLILFYIALTPCFSLAVTQWEIVPTESSIGFTATQNNAPVTGSFKSFSGDIFFDKDALKTNKVHIVIAMDSVTSAYKEVSTTLLSDAWFDVKRFPKATFDASDFTALGNNQYQAKGILTLRDKKLPILFTFTLENLNADKTRVKGSVTLKRTQFDVGQGEWRDTKVVKDDVLVDVVIVAVKK